MQGLDPRARTRRAFLRLLAVGAGAGLVSACAPIAPSSPTAPPKPTAPATSAVGASAATSAPAPAAAAPRSGGTLRVGRVGDIAKPDGHVLSQLNFIFTPQVYNALTRYAGKLQPQPELAESWDMSADGKQLKLNLRKGVQFSTGREFTSEDVKYNTLRVRDPKLGIAQLKTMSEWISDIQTPDKYTVVYQLEQPRAGIFDFLEWLFIVDKDTVEGPDAARKAVGTGPFTLTDWSPGQQIRLTKNKNYWEKGQPALDEIVVQIVTDPQALVVQLEAGALDMADGLPEREVARLGSDPKYRAILNESGAEFYYIGADVKKPPLDNKRVRQAINYALDRKRFVQTTLSGIGEPTSIPWPAHSPAFDAAKRDMYAMDLDKAKALLQDAGVSDLSLTLSTFGSNPTLVDFGKIVQADLAKIGVHLTVDNLEGAPWTEKLVAGSFGGLWSGPFAFSQLEPSSLMVMARPFNYKSNSSNFTSDRYTQLVESSIAEPDAAKRIALYSQLTDLLQDESFVMPLTARKQPLVARSTVQGAEFRVTGMVRLQGASLAG